MLVVSRLAGEAIRIGDDVIVTVVRVTPNSVRIAIEAPPDMMVIREELLGHVDFRPRPAPPAPDGEAR